MPWKKIERHKGEQSSAHEHAQGGEKLDDKPHQVTVDGKIETNFPLNLVKKYDAASDKQERWDQKKFLAEIVTIGFLFIYTTVAAWQACLTNRSLADQRDALHVLQRPWIGVGSKTATQDDVAVEEGKEPFFFTDIENFGNTPAWNETTIDNLVLRCPPGGIAHDTFLNNPPDMARWNGAKVSVNILMPHDPSSHTGGVSIGRPFTAQDMQNLVSGRCVLYYYGHTTFCDVFNQAHWRHFCSQYMPGTKNLMRICSQYNDGDEDYPDQPAEPCVVSK